MPIRGLSQSSASRVIVLGVLMASAPVALKVASNGDWAGDFHLFRTTLARGILSLP